MLIGVPKEIKKQEYRVGLVPSSVKEVVAHGHSVLVETGAGMGIGFTDEDYQRAGADIAPKPADIFKVADMILKVKEPQPQECEMLREGQILFTYLHLAADPEQTQALMKSKAVCIAYETVVGPDGHSLPLLAPMSEVAGRLSAQIGADYLLKHKGGLGRLISGAPGVSAAEVLILGGGVSGFNAARVAVGMGAWVTILEKNAERIRFLDNYFGNTAKVLMSNADNIERFLPNADIVIGAVLIPGASAPKLVKKEHLKIMKQSSVLVDIAIDQGGCFETSHPTTHNDPVYTVDGVLHYCVANMPGAVPRTSAVVLNHAVLPYALKIADKGWRAALRDDDGFFAGLNVFDGKVTKEEVFKSLNLPVWLDYSKLIKNR